MPTAFLFIKEVGAARCKGLPRAWLNRIILGLILSTYMRNAAMKDAIQKKWMKTNMDSNSIPNTRMNLYVRAIINYLLFILVKFV